MLSFGFKRINRISETDGLRITQKPQSNIFRLCSLKKRAESRKLFIRRWDLNPKHSILLFWADKDNIKMLEKLRFQHGIDSPAIILSFDSRQRLEADFTKSARTSRPIITFGKGTYYVQLPCKLEKLRQVIKKAEPASQEELDLLRSEYEFTQRCKADADFRHRCSNFTSAIRILQGAHYAGDINTLAYVTALKSLHELAGKIPELRFTADTIKHYLDELPRLKSLEPAGFEKPVPEKQATIMLLDDEAETSGWNVVLKTVFSALGYVLHAQTDRNKFIETAVSGGKIDFDILLLDLRMPDDPEKSIDLIRRLKERFPALTVIVFTAVNDIRYFNLCKKAGAFDYFVKEFGPEDRNPLAYYNKLKWLVKRGKELRDESILAQVEPEGRNEPVFWTRRVSRYIPLSHGQERMTVVEEWHTFFALVVSSVGKNADKLSRIEDMRKRLLSWLIREPADERGLTLRYISDPGSQTLTLTIICKSAAAAKEKSVQKAERLFKNVHYLLSDFPSYRFKPVRKLKDLFYILEPFKPVEIVTFGREKIDIDISGQKFHAFYPYSFNAETYIDEFIRMMLNHDEPIMLNISLWPVSVSGLLEPFARRLKEAEACFRITNAEGEAQVYQDGRGFRMFRRMRLPQTDETLAERQNLALKLLEKQVKSLENGCLYAKCDMASGSEIPSVLLETLRYDFFGARGRLKYSRLSGSNLKNEWDRIRMMTRKPLGNGPDLLKDLVDLGQALCLFQLPIPKKHGIAGIRTEVLDIIPVPADIEKSISGKDGFLIANGFGKDRTIPVKLKSKDLMKHLYICGRTGSGKSTLLLTLALSLAEKGEGICLIDPHGDLSSDFRKLLPSHRKKDIYFFDPADTHCNIGINLLENDGSEAQQDAIIQEFINIMFKLYPSDYMGPVFERTLRYSLLLIMMAGKPIADLPRIWSDEDFRDQCLERIDANFQRVKDVLNYWNKEIPEARGSKDWWGGFNTWFLSKFDRFSNDKVMRRTLSYSEQNLDFDEIINKHSLLVVRLPKGILGEVNAYTLGMITSFKVRQAIMKRGSVPEEQRHPFYLIIDEFQNFISSGGFSFREEDDATFSSLLSEARKFSCAMVLANQYIHQLGQGVRNAIFGNVQSKIFFATGAEDAEYVNAQIPFGPDASAYVACPNFYAYAQLTVNGQQTRPFTIKTIVPSSSKSKKGAT